MSNKDIQVVVVCGDIEAARVYPSVVVERIKAAGLTVKYITCEEFYEQNRSRNEVIKELRSMVIDELVVDKTPYSSKTERHTFTPPHKAARNKLRRGKR